MKTLPDSRSRPKNKRAVPHRLIHGVELYHCSNYHAWIQPSQCDRNKALGRKFLNSLSHKTAQANNGIIETCESRVDCLDCPGVVERCRRENG